MARTCHGPEPEQIAEEDYPDLSLAQVHAALAYYCDNREEIEAIFARDDNAEEEYEPERAEYLSRHAPK